MSTGNSHPRNSSDERRLYNDLDARDQVRCPVCHLKWRPDGPDDTDIHPINDTCWRQRPEGIGGPDDPVARVRAPSGPDPRRDPDQPTMPNAGHPLDRELASFRRMLPYLLAQYPGQWAIIKEETGFLIRPTFEEALKTGYEYFGLDGFLVKQILEHEPVLTGSVAWLAERDHLAGEVARLKAEVERLNVQAQAVPSHCPITGRKFFMTIEHPVFGWVPTYGGPFDSYTIPTIESLPGRKGGNPDRELACFRYDHDTGGWRGQETFGLVVACEDRIVDLELENERLIAENAALSKIHEEDLATADAMRDSLRDLVRERDKARGEVSRFLSENAQLADSLASANERLVLLQDIREAQAASIAKYRGELDASRAEVDRLGRTIDSIRAALATVPGKESTRS